jgi:prevent-host-death family protein
LRQNLSVYLDRVKEGERMEVTERGRAVALLVPLPPGTDRLERLEAEGKLSVARGSLRDYLRTREPLPESPDGRNLLDELLRQRDEERF